MHDVFISPTILDIRKAKVNELYMIYSFSVPKDYLNETETDREREHGGKERINVILHSQDPTVLALEIRLLTYMRFIVFVKSI